MRTDHLPLITAQSGDVLKQLRSLSEEQVLEFLAMEDVSERFLHEIFFKHLTLSEDTRKQALHHQNCPDSSLLFAGRHLPQWVEGCAGLAMRQLEDMAGSDNQLSWRERTERFNRLGLSSQLDWLHKAFSDKNWVRGSAYLADMADCFIEVLLEQADARDIQLMAGCNDSRIQHILATHPNHRCRVAVAGAKFLSADITPILARDKLASVRKAVAKREKLPPHIVAILVEDKNESVQDLLLKNEHIKPEQINALRKRRETKVKKGVKSSGADSIKQSLILWREENLCEKQLHALAEHSEPLIRCAAGLHPLAGQSVYNRLIDDAVEWVHAPVAGNSSDQTHLDKLFQSDDIDILRHLACNTHITAAMALALLEKTTDDQVRLALAGGFVGNTEVINRVLQTQPSTSEWELSLLEALNPSTKGQALYELYFEARQLCVSRAIARHPNCTKHLRDIFTCYLRDDVDHNPKYVARGKGYRYSDSSTKQRLEEADAHAFLANEATESDNLSHLRPAVNCHHVHVALLDQIVLNGDSATQKRFLRLEPNRQSRLVTEVLSYSGSAVVRRQLLNNPHLHESIVQRLLNDKDSTVQAQASELATQRGLVVVKDAPSPTGNPPAKRKLGNKAARLELATATKDPDILARLCSDKVTDVRRAVAVRSDLSFKQLLTLASDEVQEVALRAMQTLNDLEKDKAEQAEYQQLLKRVLSNSESSSNMLLLAIHGTDDYALIEKLYLSGRLASERRAVAFKVRSPDLVDRMLFDAKRSKRGLWCLGLASNPQLTPAQVNSLLDVIDGSVHVLHLLKSAATYIEVVKAKGYPWLRKAGEERCSEATFSIEQMHDLLDFDDRCLVLLGVQASKLPVELIIKAAEKLSISRLAWLMPMGVWPQQFIDWVFKKCQEQDERNDPDVSQALAYLMEYQKPTEEQIRYGANHAHADVRAGLGRNLAVTGPALEQLARDKDPLVREGLLYRTEIEDREGDDLSDEVLLILGADKDRDISGMAKKALVRRGVDLARLRDRETATITALLKKNNAPMGAAKANRKLLELGVLEEAQRESTSKPGEMRTFKQLSVEGQHYGVNRISDYGDATPEYYVERFPELLKKLAA
jgi:hypothetical protein